MDVDDDDEYMNAAAAHATFVMTVSAAMMYWLRPNSITLSWAAQTGPCVEVW